MTAGSYEFVQVDVFTDRQFAGNPLAVFLDGRGLSDDEMQAIAKEMNLSETTFVFPPDNPSHTAKVRIFTIAHELPFAGHPVIGTSWVLATLGRVPDGGSALTLELKKGPISVRLEGDAQAPEFLWMDQGVASFGEELKNREGYAAALGLTTDDLLPGAPVQIGSTGIEFRYVPLKNRQTVDRVVFDPVAMDELATGAHAGLQAFFFFAPDGENRVYSRMAGLQAGMMFEDPATGSANGPLGAYLVKEGLATGDDIVSIVSEQGTKMGRQSFIHLRVEQTDGVPGRIEVGGSVVRVFEGTLRIDR